VSLHASECVCMCLYVSACVCMCFYTCPYMHLSLLASLHVSLYESVFSLDMCPYSSAQDVRLRGSSNGNIDYIFDYCQFCTRTVTQSQQDCVSLHPYMDAAVTSAFCTRMVCGRCTCAAVTRVRPLQVVHLPCCLVVVLRRYIMSRGCWAGWRAGGRVGGWACVHKCVCHE